MSDTSIALMSRASQMLAEATTIQKAKELKDLALTAADWARHKGMGEEAVQHAQRCALMAERKMGALLKVSPRATGAKGIGKSALPTGEGTPPTLAELGLSWNESSRAQALDDLPEQKFEEVVAGKKTRTQARREYRREQAPRKKAALPKDKFRVLYADPPWKYGDTRNGLSTATGATTHYPCMSIAELCDLPVAELAEQNAVLFLWVTSPLLFEVAPVIKAWGFTYKASFVWDKVKHNLGHYNSVRHEFLLLCTRGSCLPDSDKLIDSVQSIERSAKHSEKPRQFRRMIEQMYTQGRKIELFARSRPDDSGWECWGDEV